MSVYKAAMRTTRGRKRRNTPTQTHTHTHTHKTCHGRPRLVCGCAARKHRRAALDLRPRRSREGGLLRVLRVLRVLLVLVLLLLLEELPVLLLRAQPRMPRGRGPPRHKARRDARPDGWLANGRPRQAAKHRVAASAPAPAAKGTFAKVQDLRVGCMLLLLLLRHLVVLEHAQEVALPTLLCRLKARRKAKALLLLLLLLLLEMQLV